MAGLLLALDLEIQQVQAFSDSQLVVNQVSQEYQAKDRHLATYIGYIQTLCSRFKFISISQIPREHNTRADMLARIATAISDRPGQTVEMEILEKPSIQKTLCGDIPGRDGRQLDGSHQGLSSQFHSTQG